MKKNNITHQNTPWGIRLRMVAFTLLISLFQQTQLTAEVRKIPLDKPEIQVPLLELQVPLQLSLFLSDGDLTIIGSQERNLRLTFEDFDPNSIGFLLLDTETGLLQVNLKGEQSESDISLHLPHDSKLGIRSADGDVNIDGISGSIEVSTSDGDIGLHNISASVSAHASDGDIHFSSADCDSIKSITLSTSDGNIDIRLAPTCSFSLSARYSDGQFFSNFPFESEATQSKSFFKGSGRLNYQHNGGVIPVLVSTVDGDIRLSTVSD